jgi:hypothetical protein
MKKYIVAVVLALSASAAYAACVTNTTFSGGRMVTCTTCCYGNNCTTNCF